MKKGGGRRYYRPDDIALLQAIRALLYDDGLSIKIAQEHIKSEGVAAIIAQSDGHDRAAERVQADKKTDGISAEPVNEDAFAEKNDDPDARGGLNSALQKLLDARSKLNDSLEKH